MKFYSSSTDARSITDDSIRRAFYFSYTHFALLFPKTRYTVKLTRERKKIVIYEFF